MDSVYARNERVEPLVGPDVRLCHASCGAGVAPSLTRVTKTFGHTMNNRSVCVVLTAIVLSACATAYQPKDTLTGGFTETQLAPDAYRIVFNGNSSTSKERAQDFALLRAAELALSAGFPFFTIQDSDNVINHSTSQGITIGMPRIEILVQFHAAKQPGLFTYDSAFLIHSLKTKYEIK